MNVGSVERCTASDQDARGGAAPSPTLHFWTNQWEAARQLVLRHHYSKRFPTNNCFVGTFHLDGGLFGNAGEPIAACVFGTPSCQWSEPILELTRLVRIPNCKPPLSRLISLCLSALKRNGYDLVISYADKKEGHAGTVYRASSFVFCRESKPCVIGAVIDNVHIHGRTCNHRWKTRSIDKLRAILPNSRVEPLWDEGKILYWKALGTRGIAKAKRLGIAA